MYKEQALQKIERYLKNSNKFLWGILCGTQSKNYEELERRGFKKVNYLISYNKYQEVRYSGAYDNVIRQMLMEHGMEKILSKLIIPIVDERFEGALDYMQRCWSEGSLPALDILKTKLKNKDLELAPLLDGDLRNNTIVGWTEFAGLWFEEIDLLRELLGDTTT